MQRRAVSRALVAGFLLVLAASLGTPAPARAAEGTLVSNFAGDSEDVIDVGDYLGGQGFVAGSDTVLTSVTLKAITTAPSATLTVSIRAKASGSDYPDHAGTDLVVLEPPATLAVGDMTYTVPAGSMVELTAGTTYFVVLEETATGDSDFESTNSTDETGVTGWTIHDVGNVYLHDNSPPAWEAYDYPFFVEIKGDTTPPGVTLSSDGLTVNEGSNGTYTVVLDSQPTEEVTVTVVSSDTGAATVNKSSLTFTTTNWETAQSVQVTAVGDSDSGDESVTITHDPSGGDYEDVASVTLPVTITDTGTQGVTLGAAPTVTEGEDAGTYTVQLAGQPSGTVTVDIVSLDTDSATVSPASMMFTVGNWDTTQDVTVTPVDDDDANAEMVMITHDPSGGGFDRAPTVTQTVTVSDADSAGIDVNARVLGPLEEGTALIYRVNLLTLPAGDVQVDITSDNADVTVAPNRLDFTTVNWAGEQQVTVTVGQDDDAENERATLTHTASGGGPGYENIRKTLGVNVTDDDEDGLVLSATTLEVTEGLTNTYTVKLQAEPAGTVTVDIASGDTGIATVAPARLTFTTINWQTEKTVTVTGVQDGNSADNTATVTNTPTGTRYDAMDVVEVTVMVDDDDKPGITFTPAARTIVEGASGTYNVKLNGVPSGTMTVAITSGDTTRVTVNPTSLTFEIDNFSTNQEVTVTTSEDADAADNPVSLAHAPDGGGYSSTHNKDFIVTVDDNDTVDLVLSDMTLEVGEAGDNSYTVRLKTQPTATVTVTVSSADTDAATVSGSLSFTTSNWSMPQTVTVSGVDDDDSAAEEVVVTHTASGGDYDGHAAHAGHGDGHRHDRVQQYGRHSPAERDQLHG